MDRIKKYDTLLINPSDMEGMKKAAEALRSGEVVAFPTETVYGLGANALDGSSVKKIFEAKGRPSDNPLIVHIWDKSQVEELVSEVTPLAQTLMDAFMPGPITVIMKKSDAIPSEVTAGLDTVGIRMPSDKTAAAFLKACGCPVAAPSANLSGSPSPTSSRHVMNDMDGYVYAVIDGAMSDVGLESTVVDATGETPVILRPGAVTKDMIDRACNKDTLIAGALKEGTTPMAPGMKYRHYAPTSEVEVIMTPEAIVGSDPIEIGEEITDEQKKLLFETASPYIMRAKEIIAKNPLARIGIFAGDEVKKLAVMSKDDILLSHVHFYCFGSAGDVKGAAHCLFDGLRHLDIQEVNTILAAGFEGSGIDEAYMNRLKKAAGKTGGTTSDMHLEKKPERLFREGEDKGDVFTASVLFVSDEDRALGAACEGLFSGLLRSEAPFCSSDDITTGAEIYAESAGLWAVDDQPADPVMIEAVKETSGRNISYHRSTRACASVYDDNDLIITMRDEQAFEILSNFPELKGKVHSLSSYAASKGLVIKDDKGRVVSISIPDPKGENKETYLHTAKAIASWLRILFPYILLDLGAERL